MIISAQNVKGGPKIKKYTLAVDPTTERLGFPIGYCQNCNEKLLISLTHLGEVVTHFNYMIEQNKGFSIREKIVKMLGGNM